MKTRDLRRYAKQTNLQLLAGFFIILFLIGDGLIWLFYGRGAALMGLICIGVGVATMAGVWVILGLMEWIVKRVNE